MVIQIIDSSGPLKIALSGILDETCTGALENALKECPIQPKATILLDFAGIINVTPAGLRTVLPLVEKVQSVKGRLAICNMNEPIRKLVQTCGFDSLVTIINP